MLNYLLLLIVSFLGLHVGALIAHFSKSELEAGRRYFFIAKSVVFSAAMFVFFMSMKLYIWLCIILAIAFFALSHLISKKKNDEFIFYTFFSLVVYETRNFSAVPAIMVFLYGILVAALEYTKFWETFKKLTVSNCTYILFGLILMI